MKKQLSFLAILLFCCPVLEAQPQLRPDNIDQVLQAMTLEEKASLVVGCSEEFYKAIHFRACLWPTPSWVWEPGDRTWLKTYDTRRWMDEKGITEHHASCVEEDWTIE